MAAIVGRYLPSSPRQLLELAMQCEELLDGEIPLTADGPVVADVYEALRVAAGFALGQMLSSIWEQAKEGAEPAGEVIPFRRLHPPAGDAAEDSATE